MLYNVLPPLIFFTSLGGIIVVVSRVVLRLRADQRGAEMLQQSASVATTRVQKTKQLASLIGPNQKSVQAIKTRGALLQRAARRLAAYRPTLPRRKRQASPAPAAPGAAVTPPIAKDRLASLRRAAASSGRLARRLRDAAREQRQALQARRAAQVPVIPPAAAETSPAAKPTISLSIMNKATPAAAPSRQREHIARRSRARSTASAIDRAKQALGQKDYPAAERMLVPHLAGHPRDVAAYILLGKAAAGQGHWDEAAEIYEQIIKIDPAHAGSQAALGRARYELGQFTKAIEALRRAHDEQPENIAVIEYLLKIARRMDNLPMQESLTQELAELEQSI